MQLSDHGRRTGLVTKLGDGLNLGVDLVVEFVLVIEIVSQRRMNLPQRKVWMLPANFVRVPMMSQMIEGNLNHLGARACQHGSAASIEFDMGIRNS